MELIPGRAGAAIQIDGGVMGNEKDGAFDPLTPSKALNRQLKQIGELQRFVQSPSLRAILDYQESLDRTLSPIREMARARQEALDHTFGPIREMARAQQAAYDRTFGPIREMARAQQEALDRTLAPIRQMARAQQEAIDLMMAPIRHAMRVQDEAYRSMFNSVAAASGAASKIAELSGLASYLAQVSRSTAHLDIVEIAESAIAQAEATAENDHEAAVDALFARYESEEYLAHREALKTELAKISDFNSLTASARFFQIIEIAASSSTVDFRSFALGIAGNLLATILGQENAAAWLWIWLLLYLLSALGPKPRSDRTREVIRSLPIDKRSMRLVDFSCTVAEQPKAKSKRLGRLQAGTVVTITDQLQAWRQVFFLGKNGEQRIGWVRSKYLRKL